MIITDKHLLSSHSTCAKVAFYAHQQLNLETICKVILKYQVVLLSCLLSKYGFGTFHQLFA